MFVLEILQKELDGLPTPTPAAAPPKDPETLTEREATDEAAKLTICVNKMLDSFAGRKATVRELMADIESQVAQLQSKLADARTDDAKKSTEEGAK